MWDEVEAGSTAHGVGANAQVATTLKRLSEQVEGLAAEIGWTTDFLTTWQEGDVAAALETLTEVHTTLARTGTVGRTD